MKIIEVPVKLFEKGDQVCTPAGNAIVIEDQLLIALKNKNQKQEDYIREISFAEVKVELLETCGEHPSLGSIVEMERQLLHLNKG